MAAKGDVDMTDATTKTQDPNDYVDLLQTNHSGAFAFSDTEKLALQLYDQLKELELQQSLLQAQQSVHAHDFSALPDDLLEERLTIAQREAMEARAEYEIRNKITHNVLVMDPVLKAVHGGEQTPFAEKRILPLVTENDAVCMVHGSLTSKLASANKSLSVAEQNNIVANQKNRELAQTMLALAEEMKAQSVQDIEDPQLRQRVDAVDKELKDSRRRVTTLKGILSAMIVGSGINWAADEGLTELVMEDEDD
ncbi:centromere protein H (CENP-H)-domain-containing protein [Alternaria rosae]|uniref:centromere protein H (CENP-H)-domain-containing protein n=1 Tax=Alternaria rosae TaxID=1187941 RepID=UPI001E8E33A3|nr:centromere protein H (CENP-H)-domain-containing protein [Alternaria rosae]KAH6872948.1 centromere protein H (CENP-H)-domain-containing protein [Alternaria rosae]